MIDLIPAKRHIHAAVNQANIVADNRLSAIKSLAITCTKADLFLIGSTGKCLSEIWIDEIWIWFIKFH